MKEQSRSCGAGLKQSEDRRGHKGEERGACPLLMGRNAGRRNMRRTMGSPENNSCLPKRVGKVKRAASFLVLREAAGQASIHSHASCRAEVIMSVRERLPAGPLRAFLRARVKWGRGKREENGK